MEKILFCTKYERLGASSRLRTFQFLPYLSNDYNCIVNSLFSNQYVKNIYTKTKQNKFKIMYSYFKRFCLVLTCSVDIIVIEKELFPYLPYWVEKLCLRNRKYIIDIDDAVFHNYDLSKRSFIRKHLSSKFQKLFSNAYHVLAGSPYLLKTASEFGASSVTYYPTVIDLSKYYVDNSLLAKDCITIGWIGTNGTVNYLDPIIRELDIISSQFNLSFKLLIIGANKQYKVNNLRIEYALWSESTEVKVINSIDIGIMPLNDTPWEQGKCAYKLIQYMGCSKPVVASAIGANNSVVDSSCGFLCSTLQDWHNAVIKLISDEKLRQSMGINGRKKIESCYNIESNLKVFRKVINDVK